MKKKYLFGLALILIFFIGLLIGTLAMAVKFKDCLGNTISYGIGELEGEMTLNCYCNFDDPSYERLFINSTGIYPLNKIN